MLNTKLLRLHQIVEAEVRHIQYGTLTFTVMLKDGLPISNSMSVMRNKRRKYRQGERV
jgi:hypothetical protein